MTTVTSREFNHDVSAAKRAASAGPVVITDRGRPAYVLLSIDAYRRLAGSNEVTGADLVTWLEMEDEIEFEPEPLEIGPRVPRL
ncbi:type II toxin-antitoxin system prevent-host-death family antitoxin [Nakamurella sp. YIM 132087]|uniref:Antitoxin n=1 Tax=Nakamurella alba TaxID=2665158 RepID=A0A7K1FFK1_9ACTN|nr:type II toxin-antitoxin system Phd/YefM family antitoxin [Nakamurella alba]MTD12895.1 type II toxin-antitoxin system prevent-host-death family antitoxin [Nakamurella alba]